MLMLFKMLLGLAPDIIGKFTEGRKNKRILANAIALKKLEGVQTKEHADIKWEEKQADASKESWKDEFWTLVFGYLLLSPIWDPEQMKQVFAAYAEAPEWFQLCVLVSVGASFGVKIWKNFAGNRKA